MELDHENREMPSTCKCSNFASARIHLAKPNAKRRSCRAHYLSTKDHDINMLQKRTRRDRQNHDQFRVLHHSKADSPEIKQKACKEDDVVVVKSDTEVANIDGKADMICASSRIKKDRIFTRNRTLRHLEQLYNRLISAEPTRCQKEGPVPRKPQIPNDWHRKLVEWLLYFPKDADIQSGTIAVAVVFMQQFLTVHKSWPKPYLQLLAMVCTFVASKVNETHGERCISMLFLTQFVANRKYTAEQIKKCELELLKTLKFKLHPVTAHALAMVMLELHPHELERLEIMKITSVILDLQLPVAENLKYSTKAVALGCISAACRILNYSNCFILSETERFVTKDELLCGEQMTSDLCNMFYKVFPERRSMSPTSVTNSPMAM